MGITVNFFACVLNEPKHTNGRTGMSAVMGSKNLKAVAVRGTKKVAVWKMPICAGADETVSPSNRLGIVGRMGWEVILCS
jgi:hypothetical protein